MSDLIEVTREQFYKVIGPLDVISKDCGPYEHKLQLRNDYRTIAICKGYKSEDVFYKLHKDFLKETGPRHE